MVQKSVTEKNKELIEANRQNFRTLNEFMRDIISSRDLASVQGMSQSDKEQVIEK